SLPSTGLAVAGRDGRRPAVRQLLPERQRRSRRTSEAHGPQPSALRRREPERSRADRLDPGGDAESTRSTVPEPLGEGEKGRRIDVTDRHAERDELRSCGAVLTWSHGTLALGCF